MARLLQLHPLMLETQSDTTHFARPVKCACGHPMRRHVIGFCTVAGCACVQEEEPAPEAAKPICQRCSLKKRPARYRIQTDEMDIVVCECCADVAEGLGLPVQSNMDL